MSELSPEQKAEVQRELAEARRILKEDRILAHNARMDERWTRVHGADPVTGDPADPNVPDPPEKKDPADKAPQKKGIWWPSDEA